jgi:hypothetical protein
LDVIKGYHFIRGVVAAWRSLFKGEISYGVVLIVSLGVLLYLDGHRNGPTTGDVLEKSVRISTGLIGDRAIMLLSRAYTVLFTVLIMTGLPLIVFKIGCPLVAPRRRKE